MAEFKKLSEVEIVESPADNANVLIEEEGVIKKVAKSAVGGGGGAEVVYLHNFGLTDVCWWANSEDVVGDTVSASEARQLYTEWLAGKIRILVYANNNLSNGGAQSLTEIVGMSMSANDAGGNTAKIYATCVHSGEIKSFSISDKPFDV